MELHPMPLFKLCFFFLIVMNFLYLGCNCHSQINNPVTPSLANASDTIHASFDIIPTTRRSLLPRATAISDQHLQLLSHVVRIKSLSNGVGTGLLLQRNFVITAKQVVKTFLDPFEFTVQLGNAEAHGLDVVVHPSQDLAVIKIHPPIDNTGRIPISGSPKGFFWPIAHGDPKPGSLVKVYGYGGSFSYGSKNFLTFHSFNVAGPGANNIIFVRTESNVPTTSGDAGGPGLFNNATLLGAVVTSSKPLQGALTSLARNRDWTFDAMRSSCSREEQIFTRLLVDTDPDILIYYHCKVERAERLGIYLYSKPTCNSVWKAVAITNKQGATIAMVETGDNKNTDSALLSESMFKKANSHQFYIELWKAKLLGVHTNMAKYGPFNMSEYIDGGLHFEWCAS